LLQKWKHKASDWDALPVDQQERIMGRTKLDSVELENKIVCGGANATMDGGRVRA
jgi:deferrochelatase/peroxidase EfeB